MARWIHSPAKRAFDVIAAGSALVVLAPVIAVVAVLVRLRLGTPVLFRQVRAGRGGAPIEVAKFRTMNDARGDDGELLDDAERLTAFGAALRASSLDELPQLWTIVRGDMSLIGPRPLPTVYNERYSDEQRRRLDATPGLTGWSQVNGRNAVDWPTKLRHDVWYVDNASWVVDARIIGRTLRALISRRDVTADGHVTMPEFMGES